MNTKAQDQSKKIIVYHHNDHDGIVAAGVLYNYMIDKWGFGYEDFQFNMIDYDQELNFDNIDFKRHRVYFLDYSFSNNNNFEQFKLLIKRRTDFSDVYWFDHHVTSLDLIEKIKKTFPGIVIPGLRYSDLCASALVYLYYYKEYTSRIISQKSEFMSISDIFHNDDTIPPALKYIDDYDCWKHIYPETNDFHYGLTVSNPKDRIISELLDYDTVYKIDNQIVIYRINTAGKAVQKYLDFENKEYHVNMYGFEYTLPEEAGGFRCFCMNRKGNSLMFGDKIKEYDAVIPFYYINGKWKYSIFTEKDNVDCEEVAKYYGGGGHKKAAGWVIDDLIFNE